jgi:hypothetical protein
VVEFCRTYGVDTAGTNIRYKVLIAETGLDNSLPLAASCEDGSQLIVVCWVLKTLGAAIG